MSGPNASEPSDCTLRPPPLPASELQRYRTDADPDSERDIARYVEIEARNEKVQHVERVKTEVVLGESYDIWDVVTDKGRWWVLTNLTNLYSQEHFPSLDYTITFHVGLMMRMRSRPEGAQSNDPSPFDEVVRRQEQAKNRCDRAIEPEDFQAVAMQLRECLISLIAALRRRVVLDDTVERPQEANFQSWYALIMDQMCRGKSNKELRQYLKNTARDTWQLVNWLVHDRDANKTAVAIAIHACDTVVGHSLHAFIRGQEDHIESCPSCQSRIIRTHFEPTLGQDGEYYQTCGACRWSSHPAG